MISYKMDVLESWSLSDVKMGRGSPIVKWCLAKYGDPYSEFVLCI